MIRNSTLQRSLIYLLPVFLMSCIGTRKFGEDLYRSREADKQSFVEKSDGARIEAKEAVLRTPLFGRPAIELDKDTRIPLQEVVAYQDNKAYYRKIEGQFAPRFKKGLISMYVTEESYQELNTATGSKGSVSGSGWRTRYRTVYWLQKEGGTVERFTPERAGQYVKDYAPSAAYMLTYETTQKKVRTWSWLNTVAVIGGALVAGSSVNGQEIRPHGYVGLGFFLGGLANGVVNRLRKAKNLKNVEAAIDTYNDRVPGKN